MTVLGGKRYFPYGEKEMEYLKKKDRKLGHLIDMYGRLEREINGDIFKALVESVIGQQISDKAASAICKRFADITEITPEKVHALDESEIQKCGTSARKAGYIKNIARAVVSKELDVGGLKDMSDSEVIAKLTEIKGVGRWTAEMMLIFSLGRPDIVSYGDLGIRRNMMALYGIKDLTREKFERCAKRYSPYGTIASFYLWSMTDIYNDRYI